jgi:hypothetical protein
LGGDGGGVIVFIDFCGVSAYLSSRKENMKSIEVALYAACEWFTNLIPTGTRPRVIIVEIPQDKFDKIQNVGKLCGTQDVKMVINSALTLFEWAVGEKRKGYAVGSVNTQEETYREVSIPLLNSVSDDLWGEMEEV